MLFCKNAVFDMILYILVQSINIYNTIQLRTLWFVNPPIGGASVKRFYTNLFAPRENTWPDKDEHNSSIRVILKKLYRVT